MFEQLGKALGIEESGYEIGIRVIRMYGSKTVAEVLQLIVGKLLPNLPRENADDLLQRLDMMATREKAFEILRTLPPLNEQERDIADELSLIPIRLRETLLEAAKHLPHDHGGRPSKLPSPDECQRIRDEIASLRAHGVRIGDAQKRVAKREGLKASMVRRIWQEVMRSKESGENRTIIN